MYACDHLEKGVLNTLRGTSFAAPSKCWLGLWLSDPGETGAAGVEVSYPGYQRLAVEFSAPAEGEGGTSIQSVSDLTFATPPAAVGSITHVGVLDSLSGGNMLARSELVEPLPIGAEEPPVLLAGDVLLTLTGDLSRAWKIRVLNLFRGQSLPAAAPFYALWNGSPDGGGAELSGANYQRAALTFGIPEEQPSGQVLAKNTAPAAFPRPTAAWGTWTHSALFTAGTAGEAIWIRARAEPKEIRRGYMPRAAEGTVTVGLN